jgi:hypothetical protein
MNLNHFCDPEKNHYQQEEWPNHKACSGDEIINYGTKNQQMVKCECGCHEQLINIEGVKT